MADARERGFGSFVALLPRKTAASAAASGASLAVAQDAARHSSHSFVAARHRAAGGGTGTSARGPSALARVRGRRRRPPGALPAHHRQRAAVVLPREERLAVQVDVVRVAVARAHELVREEHRGVDEVLVEAVARDAAELRERARHRPVGGRHVTDGDSRAHGSGDDRDDEVKRRRATRGGTGRRPPARGSRRDARGGTRGSAPPDRARGHDRAAVVCRRTPGVDRSREKGAVFRFKPRLGDSVSSQARCAGRRLRVPRVLSVRPGRGGRRAERHVDDDFVRSDASPPTHFSRWPPARLVLGLRAPGRRLARPPAAAARGARRRARPPRGRRADDLRRPRFEDADRGVARARGRGGDQERDAEPRDHELPEYRSVHPFGKIPGMRAADGETGIFESGALMLYVADLAGSLPTPEARGAAASWVIWANATMWPALETSRGRCDLDALFGPVDEILGRSAWLLGDELSVADVAVAAYVKYAQMFFGMKIPESAFPNLARYMADVDARPHFRSTVGGG